MYSIEFEAHGATTLSRWRAAAVVVAVACAAVALFATLFVAAGARKPLPAPAASPAPQQHQQHQRGLHPHRRRASSQVRSALTAIAVGAAAGHLAANAAARWAPAAPDPRSRWPSPRTTASYGSVALAALHLLSLATPGPGTTTTVDDDVDTSPVVHQPQQRKPKQSLMSSSSLADAGRDGGGVVVPPLPPELWEMIATHVAADDLRSRMALASVSRGMFDGPSGRRIRYESILHQVFPGGDAAGNLTGAGVVAQLDVFMRDFADRGLTRAVHLKHLAERIPAVIHFHSVYAVLDAILPLATSQAALLDRLDRLIEAPTAEFLLRALAEVCLTRRTRQCLDLLRARCAATNSTLKVPSPTTTTEDVDAAVAHLRLALDEQDFAYLPAEYVGDNTHGDALPCNVMHLMMQGVPAGLLVDDAATTMQEGGARLPDRVLSGPLYFYMSAAAHGSPLRHFQSSLAGIALDLDHPVSFLDGLRDVSLLVPDEQDLTPVKRAVFRDQVGVVDDLARMDARVLHDPTGEPAFLFAVRCARWPSVALIAALVNPESPSSAWQMRSAMPKWRNALLTACSAGVVDLFDHVSFDGERRQTDWVVPDALLLSVDAGNHTCLHLAVYSGWRYREQVVPVALDRVEAVVRALCDRAVALRLLVPFVSVRTNNGRTALMGAIAAGLNSVIGILFDYLERHASPDDIWALLSVQDRHNRSALHFAVDEQNARAFDLVVACLQRQAPARVPHLLALRNHENRTALDLMPADDPVWASVRANLSIATSSSSSLLAAARLRRRALGADVADHNHNLSEKFYL